MHCRILNSHYRVFEREPDIFDGFDYTQIGYVIELLSAGSSRQRVNASYVNEILKPAIRHQQMKCLFNEDGNPAAYVVWAMLAQDVEWRFINTGFVDLHFSEWNEGDRLWILDLVVKPGHLGYVLRYLRDVLFSRHYTVRYFRHAGERYVVREISRDDGVSFFSNIG